MGQIIGIHTQSGALSAYTAEPEQKDFAGGIVLLHDVWGLDDHTKSLADRLAQQGYHVVAPSLLGGTEMEKRIRPELRESIYSPSRRERSQAQLRLQTALMPLRTPQIASLAIIRAHASFEYLYNQPVVRNQVGVMGFGFGGTHTLSLAIRDNRIMGAAVFYPQANFTAYELRHIACPVLAFCGDHDQAAYPSYQRLIQQLSLAQVQVDSTVCSQVGSSFYDEATPGAYNGNAVEQSWAHTMAFFHKNLIG